MSITTPKGKAVYPHVNTPSTKFNPLGEYSCNIIVSKEDADAFKAKITEMYDKEYERECVVQNKPKLKKSPHFPVLENEDGDWVIRTKQPAKVESRSGQVYEFKVNLFDAKGKPIQKGSVNVGSGSTVRCGIEPRFWYNPSIGFGVTLSLKAVQVLDLVEGNGAGSFDFEQEEGYEAEEFSDEVLDEALGSDF